MSNPAFWGLLGMLVFAVGAVALTRAMMRANLAERQAREHLSVANGAEANHASHAGQSMQLD